MTLRGDHDQKPYEEISLPDFAERAAKSFKVERPRLGTMVLRGPCPRCGAVMEFVIVDHLIEGTLGPRPLGHQGHGAGEAAVLLYCRCEDEHPLRPAGRKGCGAYWTLVAPGLQ
jgi:hypothetical protein